MSESLAERVLLVTGGTRGIGRAIARGAAERGAHVAFCARTLGEEAQSLCAEIESLGREGLAIRADVSREQEVLSLFKTVLDTFGRVDVVVNNAGVSLPNLLVLLTTEEWDTLIATNLSGAFLVAREAIRCFLRQGGGRIVSIGSITQHGVQANAGYATSKGGLIGLTQAIATEYGEHGIAANLIVAGAVETAMAETMPESLRHNLVQQSSAQRFGTPSEIASAVLFLASEQAAGLNGQVIYVGGGLREAPRY